jgi:acetyl/propionyl-CoA carboxylase alpha subunit
MSFRDPFNPPPSHSIQLRITAENVKSDWLLSIGKITSFQFPSGNGIRVDTHLVNSHSTVISADFDSLIAKIVVTASSWQDTVKKAHRALEDTRISGVKTNLAILRGIIAHPDFLAGKCDTQWLESKQTELLALGEKKSSSSNNTLGDHKTPSTLAPTAANTLFRKGDAWSINLAPPTSTANTTDQESSSHHLELTRVLRNDFPASLSVEVLFTTSTPASTHRQSTPYTLTLASTSATASTTTSHHRRANPSDPSHISIPFPGKLAEVLVDEGDLVKEGDVVCVVQQMKMELEVRSPRSGRVIWVTEAEDGEDVAEGMLAAVVEREREREREARL